jgi:hypothetical protein
MATGPTTAPAVNDWQTVSGPDDWQTVSGPGDWQTVTATQPQPGASKPGFMDSFLQGINPLNSIPAAVKGAWDSLTPAAVEGTNALNSITPAEWAAHQQSLQSRRAQIAGGATQPGIKPGLPDFPDAPSTGATAGQLAATGVNTAALGLLAEGALRGYGALPSTVRAAGNFDKVMAAAANEPINVGPAGDAALRAQQLADAGATRPKIVGNFLKAVTDPNAPPMTYAEGRDFASNAGRLSATERQAANPPMQRQVSILARALNDANEEAANRAGVGNEYRAAMAEYRKAQQLKSAAQIGGKIIGGGLLGYGLLNQGKSYLKGLLEP